MRRGKRSAHQLVSSELEVEIKFALSPESSSRTIAAACWSAITTTYRDAPPSEIQLKLHQAAMLVLAGWYLMVPSTAPTSGEANAAPSPTTFIWNTYKSREACETDRQSLSDDPVVGSRMTAAKCVQMSTDSHSQTK